MCFSFAGKGLVFFSLLFLSLAPKLVFASEDPLSDLERQRIFVERFSKNLEKEQLTREAERQAELKRRQALKKRRDEARVAAQFAGLSRNLSGLPELPAFEGKFETEPANRTEKNADEG